MNLSSYLHGRDNNFNLIRIIAAIAVLITHSFALTYGSADVEPLRETLGFTLGTIAVDVFFITSGFLVTASLLRSQSTIEFIWARFLRVYPGLVIMLIITALIISPFLTSVTYIEYFTSTQLWIYLLKGFTVVKGFSYDLPGVFANNPYKNAVNGSLWTLKYEVYMYVILVFIWFTLKFSSTNRNVIFSKIITALFLISAFYIFFHIYLALPNNLQLRKEIPFLSLFYMFFGGATFYIYREKIFLTKDIVLSCCLVMILSISNKAFFLVVYMLTIPFILFYLAFVPKGFIRYFNKVGDYSYGVYIYAFFIQQAIINFFRDIPVENMIFYSLTISMVFAVFSWHVIESKALRLRKVCIEFTNKKARYFKSLIRTSP